MQQTVQQLECSAAGALLLRVFRALDDATIPYCVMHGYDAWPQRIDSDVDLLMAASALPLKLAQVLHDRQAQIGARVVQWFAGESHFVILSSTEQNGEGCFLHLHVSPNVNAARRRIYDGDEILRHRQRRGEFWIPSARHEFACLLARRIEKRKLSADQHVHLELLRQSDTVGCAGEVERLLGHAAALSDVSSQLPHYRRWMLARAGRRRPGALARNVAVGCGRVLARGLRADRGLNVVILGPDGSGKSSIVESMRQDLAGAFVGWQRRTFPPALRNRASGSNSTPHALKPRSWLSSTTRAIGYWLIYATLGYPLTVGRAKSAGKLVVHDRHLLDALVDPKRYRYAGPMGLLRGIARLADKGDLVLLLDAPAEVIQSRKHEVEPRETERQLHEYRKLAGRLSHAAVIDVNRSLSQVVDEVNRRVLDYLAQRVEKRFGLAGPRRSSLDEMLRIHGSDAREVKKGGSIRYAVLPSRAKARWFIPLGNAAVSAAGLSIASPSRPTARLAHACLRAIARTGLPIWYRDRIAISNPQDGAIERVLKGLFPDQAIRLAISLGSPPPTRNRKVSLMVMGQNGTMLAWAKLPGPSAASLRSVRAEARALAALQSKSLHLPRLLWAGEVDGTFMTVASPLPGRSPGMRLTAAHEAFLSRLRSSQVKNAGQTELAASLRHRAELLDRQNDLHEILDRVLARLSALELSSTIVHGDFAPWNLRIDAGRLGAFDWEYAQLDGLPLIDEIHHLLAVGYLVRRWSAAQALARLRQHAAARPLDYQAEIVRTLQQTYLLDYLLRLLSEGYDERHGRLGWCREILLGLSDEARR